MYGAIDIGGTKTEVALYKSKELDSLAGTFTIPTDQDYIAGRDKLFVELKNHLGEDSLQRIGVSFPGIVTPEGTILQASNLLDYTSKPLKQELEAAFGASTHLVQDASCSAVAEYMYGDIQRYQKVVHLIMGTGIGGSFIEKSGNDVTITPMEPGGMVVALNDRSHQFSNVGGILEAYVGGGNVEDFYKLKLGEVADDHEIWDEITSYLAAGINNLNCILRPEAVVIGGGIGLKRQAALRSVIDKIQPYNEFVVPPKIEFTKVAGNSSLIGALAVNFVEGLKVNP